MVGNCPGGVRLHETCLDDVQIDASLAEFKGEMTDQTLEGGLRATDQAVHRKRQMLSVAGDCNDPRATLTLLEQRKRGLHEEDQRPDIRVHRRFELAGGCRE